MIKRTFKDIDEYIASFPENIQVLLEKMRTTIKTTAPNAIEGIKYAMPVFMLNGNLVYFAAFKNHIGFYPTPAANEAFKKELSVYKTGKGSIQFLIEEAIPYELISQIVEFRVLQNLEKSLKKNNGYKKSAKDFNNPSHFPWIINNLHFIFS
jgi:uncharacterized protein YdhG (YjbR/CyaY superfamily)